MEKIKKLLEQNRQWAKDITESDPEFFTKLSKLQEPEYLWIGCSDSRITPVSSMNMLPGEMFVHRNIANVVVHTDMSCLSVLQFAVEVLKVKHIIVCGHYGCGGVKAALSDAKLGLIDNWLRHIQDLIPKYRNTLENTADDNEKLDKLCELNVIEQAVNVCETTILRSAWERGQSVMIHGWIYSIADGIYRDMNVTVDGENSLKTVLKTLTELN